MHRRLPACNPMWNASLSDRLLGGHLSVSNDKTKQLISEVSLIIAARREPNAWLDACAKLILCRLKLVAVRIWVVEELDLERRDLARNSSQRGWPGAMPLSTNDVRRIVRERTPRALAERHPKDDDENDLQVLAGWALIAGGQVVGAIATESEDILAARDFSALGTVADIIAIGIQSRPPLTRPADAMANE